MAPKPKGQVHWLFVLVKCWGVTTFSRAARWKIHTPNSVRQSNLYVLLSSVLSLTGKEIALTKIIVGANLNIPNVQVEARNLDNLTWEVNSKRKPVSCGDSQRSSATGLMVTAEWTSQVYSSMAIYAFVFKFIFCCFPVLFLRQSEILIKKIPIKNPHRYHL